MVGQEGVETAPILILCNKMDIPVGPSPSLGIECGMLRRLLAWLLRRRNHWRRWRRLWVRGQQQLAHALPRETLAQQSCVSCPHVSGVCVSGDELS